MNKVVINPRPVGEAGGYCNRFVCLSAKVQQTYEHWHFENTTSRRKIIQGSKVTIGFC